jgi:hypothetical protein
VSITRTQAMANVREMMDAASSSRWTDAFVKTAIGIVHGNEWRGILAANPTHRFAQRSVTTSAAGVFAYSSLTSGSGNTVQTFYRILAITDGNDVVYRETRFQEVPTASSSQVGQVIDGLWYDAGTNVQILPPSALTLTVSVNYTPCRADSLNADSDTIDFPEGHESILWLEAAAYLLSKNGAENEAAQTLRAMAEAERQMMYQEITRRGAGPIFLGFNDSASEWAG